MLGVRGEGMGPACGAPQPDQLARERGGSIAGHVCRRKAASGRVCRVHYTVVVTRIEYSILRQLYNTRVKRWVLCDTREITRVTESNTCELTSLTLLCHTCVR